MMKLQETSDPPHGPRFTRPWIVADESEIPRHENNKRKKYKAKGPDGEETLDYIVYDTHGGYVKRTKKGKIKVPNKVGEQLLKDPGVVGIEKRES